MRATCVHQNGSAQRIIEAVEEVEGSQLAELREGSVDVSTTDATYRTEAAE